MTDASIIVMAKAPLPGRVKTRLGPPCTPEEAAALAEAALADTLRAALSTTGAARVVLALDGGHGWWRDAGARVIAQRGKGLDERLAHAFADVGGRSLLIGMDTPHVTPALLDDALATLDRDGVDAVLGPAADGGWWALGMRRPDARALLGVPMSTRWTGDQQRARLGSLGLRVELLPTLADVDDFATAVEVAAAAPHTEFAAAMAALEVRV